MANKRRVYSPSTTGEVLPNNIKELDTFSGRDTSLSDSAIAVEQVLGPDGRLVQRPTLLSATERFFVGFHIRSKSRG